MDLTEEEINQLRQLEESLLRPEIRSSGESMNALLEDGFIEIGASGLVYDKRQTMEAVIPETHAQLPLSDFAAKLLAPSVALVTYRSIQTNSHGSSKEARRTSIWTKKNNNWKIVFHQGTLLR